MLRLPSSSAVVSAFCPSVFRAQAAPQTAAASPAPPARDTSLVHRANHSLGGRCGMGVSCLLANEVARRVKAFGELARRSRAMAHTQQPTHVLPDRPASGAPPGRQQAPP